MNLEKLVENNKTLLQTVLLDRLSATAEKAICEVTERYFSHQGVSATLLTPEKIDAFDDQGIENMLVKIDKIKCETHVLSEIGDRVHMKMFSDYQLSFLKGVVCLASLKDRDLFLLIEHLAKEETWLFEKISQLNLASE